MKGQIKTPEKELSNEEIDNLSDVEFKTLVIRIFTELIELSHKMKEQIKVPEKIQLRDGKIPNLSDAQFRTLAIRSSGCSEK